MLSLEWSPSAWAEYLDIQAKDKAIQAFMTEVRFN